MNKLQTLIAQHCPNGVEYEVLKKVVLKNAFKQTGASELEKMIISKGGGVKLLPSSKNNNWWTDEKTAGDFLCKGEVITLGRARYANIKYHNGKFVSSNNHLITPKNKNEVIGKYLFYFIEANAEKFYVPTSTYPKLDSDIFDNLKIPIPPIPVQEEIVRILDAFTNSQTELQKQLQTELELRKKQYKYYRDKLLCFEDIDGGGGLNVEYRTLGEIGEVKMCKRIFKDQTSSSGDIPFFKIGTFGKEPNAFISEDLFISYKSKYPYPKKGDILISASGTIGKTIIFDGSPSYFQDSNIVWIDNNEEIVLNKYLYYFYQIAKWEVSGGGTITRLYNDGIKHTKIPIPPLEEQKRIVGILDKFDKLVNDISIGIPAEIEMRKKQYEYYRDELLRFEGV